MKRLATTLLSIAMIGTLLAGCGAKTDNKAASATTTPAPAAQKVYKVGLTQIVEHPSLDTARKGIIDGLAAAGFEDGKNLKIDFQSAQGDQGTATQIGQKFAADKKDIIIALATPSAQAAAAATKEIPIVFGTVTDPVGAKLVASWEKPGGNVTGTSDMSPVKDQLALFAKLGTSVKRVGIIYNAGEANSVSTVNQVKAAAPGLGLQVVEATVSNANEVQQAAQSLIGRVDGFYLITDNTLAQGVQSVTALANQKKLPTVSAERSFVDQGALATLGLDYYELGKQTGAMAAQILQGKKPADIPVETSKDLKLIINTKTAGSIGLTVPADLLKQAEQVNK